MKKQNRAEETHLCIVGDQDHAARLLCLDPMTGDYTWRTAEEWLKNRHFAWNGIVTGNLQNILIMADAFDLIPHKKRQKKS